MKFTAGLGRATSPWTRPLGSGRLHNPASVRIPHLPPRWSNSQCPQSRRPFSSTPPLAPITARDLLTRILERRSVYSAYKADGVFAPTMGMAGRWLLFALLQIPRETVVNVPDFLEGATRAVASVVQATSSRDFTAFVVATDASPSPSDASVESLNAQRLRQWCLPNCYDVMVGNVRNSWARQRMFEIESITVESIYLTAVRYDRVSQDEMRDDPVLAQQVPVRRKWSEDATIERLQLNVGFTTIERTRQTLLDQKKVRIVDAQWYYQAALLSDVTSPSVIDWRVAAMVAERGLGQTLISEADLEEETPTPSATDEPSSETKETETTRPPSSR